MPTSIGHSERPIRSTNEDKLGRDQFVRRFAEALINPATQKATGIVVGITGQWGSGKSSILNLLKEYIKTAYKNALVVSFDPWLVSGRNDLITAFISELLGTIKATPRLKQKLTKLAKAATVYGAHLAPSADLIMPGAGIAAKAGLKAIETALARDKSLHALRAKVMEELGKTSVPIVVLIDELDRVEDEEIRTVAQLVRSVADFPGISYVLAYDQRRVIEALGAGASDDARGHRGRAYLEKIVQWQIPLPLTFGDEIERLMTANLDALRPELGLPEDFQTIERYRELVGVLTAGVIVTLRDIKRLTGTFHAIAGMVRGEVDSIDLLAYCALLIKAPQTIEKLRSDPEPFAEDTLSARALRRRLELDKLSLNDRIPSVVPAGENNDGVRRLLGYLFPAFQEQKKEQAEYPDALSLRRPLLTTLRLGLIPGAYSRADIQALARKSETEVERALQMAFQQDTLGFLIDRFDDLYIDLTDADHVAFWSGVGGFLRKTEPSWMVSYSPMHETTRAFVDSLERSVKRKPKLRSTAEKVFLHLKDKREISLTSHWLRDHVFIYGLFGCRQSGRDNRFLTAEQTERIAIELSQNWRDEHLAGRLLPALWDLHPVYIMIDTKAWDDNCRTALDAVLTDDRALDGFTLMLYGAHYTTGVETVQQMCSYQSYINRVNQRLASDDINEAHETVRYALNKAVKGGWP